MTRRITLTKKRMLIALPFVVLMLAGTSWAAWAIFAGNTGTATKGSIAVAGSAKALTFADDATGTATAAVPGGASGVLPLTIANSAGVSETPSGVTVTFTTPSNSVCQSHLTPAPGALASLQSLAVAPTGASTAMAYTADASMPIACSGVAVTATFGGTTTP